MDGTTIIAIVIGIGLALLYYFLVDDPIDKLFDWVFRIIGLGSGTGPLVTEVSTENDRIVLRVENQGKGKIKLAALEGRDGKGTQKFPTPYLNGDGVSHLSSEEAVRKNFIKTVVPPGQSITVILNKSEVASLDCQTLAFLDIDGESWPVDDFHAADL